MIKYTYIVCLILCTICTSCVSSSNQRHEDTVNYWNKRTLPIDSILFRASKVSYEINKPNGQEKFHIVGYIDSTVCTSCRLEALNEFLSELYSKTNGALGSLLIVSNSTSTNTDSIISSYYNFPYYVDDNNWIKTIKKFPSEDLYRIMLLDSEYKVIAIGNPIVSPKMRSIYLKTILGEDYEYLPQTDINVESKIIDVGLIKKDVSHSKSIKVCNIGKNNLHFLYVYSTCGCLHAYPDKRYVKPDSVANINVTFKTSIKGRFVEKIFIKCNTSESPIMITIKGIAE